MSDDGKYGGYTYEDRKDLSKMTLEVEPRNVRAFDQIVYGKMPFYRAVNSAIHFFIQVFSAKDGDEIEFPVPSKVAKIRVVVKR
jgi:hypothetical protein